MGALTEIEIFDRMVTSLRSAIDTSDAMARSPLRGWLYDKLRRDLRLIDGCCRQAATWRSDARWLPIGVLMTECHKRSGDWLRGIQQPDGSRVKVADGEMNPMFQGLANCLRGVLALAIRTRDERTGVAGPILAPVMPGPIRTQGRQVQVKMPTGESVTEAGIIIPNGARVQVNDSAGL